MEGKREEKTIMRIVNLENENRKFIKTVDNFHVLEYVQDASVSPMNAIDEYSDIDCSGHCCTDFIKSITSKNKK